MLRKMTRLLKSYLTDEEGQGMVEYILIVGLIVLAIVIALYVFRDAVKNFIQRIAKWLDDATLPANN